MSSATPEAGGGERPTPGPWIQFSDQGRTAAILPAMRPGSVCAFVGPVTDADARLMAASPALLTACLLFLKYDAADHDSDVQMMLDYAAALEATKAAIDAALDLPRPTPKVNGTTAPPEES